MAKATSERERGGARGGGTRGARGVGLRFASLSNNQDIHDRQPDFEKVVNCHAPLFKKALRG